MSKGKESDGSGEKGRTVGGLRIGQGLRRRKARKKAKKGLPPQAWNATGLSKASQQGHRAAGPIMQYGDDT
jgi:hypothetical protein